MFSLGYFGLEFEEASHSFIHKFKYSDANTLIL